MEIAIAPCCWGIFRPSGNRIGWTDYLDRVAAAGYRRTELGPYGYLATDTGVLRRELDRRGLGVVAAAHVHTMAAAGTVAALMDDLHRICALLAAVGGTHLVLMDESEFYPKDRMGVVDETGWRRVVAQTLCAADIAREHGLRFCFHPHVGTCVEREDQIERLLAETDPATVDLCLDTGHHAYWNADPKAFFLRHRARIGAVHLKNVDGALRRQVLEEHMHCDRAFEEGIMTPLEDGVVDIADFVRTAIVHGYDGPLVVEQDLSPRSSETPETSAARNHAFLSSLLGGGGGR